MQVGTRSFQGVHARDIRLSRLRRVTKPPANNKNMGACTNTSNLSLQTHLTHPPTLPPSQPANKAHGRSHKHKQPIKHKQPSIHNQPISPNSFLPTSSACKLQHQTPPNFNIKLQHQTHPNYNNTFRARFGDGWRSRSCSRATKFENQILN